MSEVNIDKQEQRSDGDRTLRAEDVSLELEMVQRAKPECVDKQKDIEGHGS